MEKLFSPWRSKYISSFVGGEESDRCVLCDAYASSEDEESLVVYRGNEAFVLMNKFPYNSGHLMVLPTRHTSDFPSLNGSELLETMALLAASERALRELFHPQGFNIGMNLGRAAGAGIDTHLHWHIVPRWGGDTNFFPLIGETKVLPETLEQTYSRLQGYFNPKGRA